MTKFQLDDLKKDVKKAADYTKETAPEAPTIDLPPQMLPESGIPASFDTGARVPPPSRSSPAAKEINAVNATIDNIAVDAHAGDSNAFVGDVRYFLIIDPHSSSSERRRLRLKR